MARVITGICISREEYADFLQLMPDDFDFPGTYEAWLQKTSHEMETTFWDGNVLNVVTVKVRVFTDWCAHAGFTPSAQALEAFAVTKSKTPQLFTQRRAAAAVAQPQTRYRSTSGALEAE